MKAQKAKMKGNKGAKGQNERKWKPRKRKWKEIMAQKAKMEGNQSPKGQNQMKPRPKRPEKRNQSRKGQNEKKSRPKKPKWKDKNAQKAKMKGYDSSKTVNERKGCSNGQNERTRKPKSDKRLNFINKFLVQVKNGRKWKCKGQNETNDNAFGPSCTWMVACPGAFAIGAHVFLLELRAAALTVWAGPIFFPWPVSPAFSAEVSRTRLLPEANFWQAVALLAGCNRGDAAHEASVGIILDADKAIRMLFSPLFGPFYCHCVKAGMVTHVICFELFIPAVCYVVSCVFIYVVSPTYGAKPKPRPHTIWLMGACQYIKLVLCAGGATYALERMVAWAEIPVQQKSSRYMCSFLWAS